MNQLLVLKSIWNAAITVLIAILLNTWIDGQTFVAVSTDQIMSTSLEKILLLVISGLRFNPFGISV